jgi:7,8-dihydro-6-hydroxymethylpterin-pyrophosphokinase
MPETRSSADDVTFNCIIALGSNLGDKAANIDKAIDLLT